jgi:hypothetical protein
MLQMIKAFALLGGEWVLYILLGLSIWSIAVIWDRFFLFRQKAKESELLQEKAPELLLKGQVKEVQKEGQRIRDSGSQGARTID